MENLTKNPQISKWIRVFAAIKNIKLKKQRASSVKVPKLRFWLTSMNAKKLAHDNSRIQIICAFSYTDTASTTRCVFYNSEVFELFVSIEEHYWRFSFYFQMSWYHYFLMSSKTKIHRKPSSGFEFKIIFVIIYLWFIIVFTPPAARYIAPKVCFVEPFVISPKSSKETC